MTKGSPNSIIRLIEMLATSPKSKKTLSESLNLSIKQVGRLLEKVENIGYFLEETENKEFFIFGADLLKNRLFDDSEKKQIKKVIKAFGDSNPLNISILRKLSSLDISIPLIPDVKDVNRGKNYQNILYAIKANQYVWLRAYFSPNGKVKMKDRYVFPLSFIDNDQQFIAYEKSSRREKTFKLDRVGIVEVTGDTAEIRTKGKQKTDAFGITTLSKQYHIDLKLSDYAGLLMMEEFNETHQYLEKKEEGYEFRGPISANEGIGRFILSLPGQIEIIKGKELLNYLIAKKKEFNF
ncbi:WYL domain-containing protein [Arcticibacterium luteifluviistationis]|uniref:Uncharacterized protein n=1 Tax=Arcticibacterium luteifluviistationis TaxID=1784714 RepID=A0A2Z4G9Z9_9BACT|nr:WYL domain-containing protein [Arcticibacterium luteifluviistationis]AWV98062.1 hypothetical protein DJ013_07705 [Arcticibacterium luteifluviistationis]